MVCSRGGQGRRPLDGCGLTNGLTIAARDMNELLVTLTGNGLDGGGLVANGEEAQHRS